MSDTRPTGTTHDPDAVERIAEEDIGGYWGLCETCNGDGTDGTSEEWPCRDCDGLGLVSLDAIDALYDDEGGARP